MRLITNKDNSSSLKILIAGECSGTTLDLLFLDKPTPDTGLKRSPLLEVSPAPGDIVFSTNAAAYLLYPPSENSESAVDNWLDWEAVHLQPSVLQCIDAQGTVIEPLLTHLTLVDNALKKSKYLVKNEVSAADISVWSTLFPLFSEEKLKSQLNNFEKLVGWFSQLEKLPQFQSGLDKLKPAGGMTSLQSIQSTTWFPTRQSPIVTNESLNKDHVVKESEIEEVKKCWSVEPEKRPKPRPPAHPLLPKRGERNILVTSALPYVNNVPHLGNIIGCVLSADVFARYCRLRNWNTLYISGTDEYGTATETKALEENLNPQQICDKYCAIHKEIYSWFNIKFDLFGRTTSSQQTQIVQEMFLAVHKKGYTSTQFMDQLLCEKCDRFLADRFVEGVCPKCSYEDARGDQCDACGQLINAVELIKPRCKVCGNTPVVKQSQQLFLDLPKIAGRLQKWVEETGSGWSQNAEVITKSWLKDGLKPRCITRDLKWGIPVPLPGFENKVFYVWFDAPIGYMSMTKSYASNKWKEWWQPEPNTKVELFQFMAKDNVPFHAIMFPATLMAADCGYTIVNHIYATEYLNYEDGKFSKSRGVGVFGTDARDTGISADVFRFYLLYMRPEGQDSSFSWVDLATKNNSELLNNLGNFVNRALMFCEKFYSGIVPEMLMTEEEWIFLAQVVREVQAYNQAMERSRLREGIIRILNISRLGNQYMQVCEPWQNIKGSDTDKAHAKTCIGVSCNIACLLTILLKPYMPKTAEIMSAQLNAPRDLFVLNDNIYQILHPGHRIGKPSPLFAKIEPSTVEQLKKRFAGRQQTPPKTHSIAPSVNLGIDTVDKMEVAVKKQADLVRSMKEGGTAKAEWQPHVQVLLEMKKQLEAMKLSNPATPKASTNSSTSIAALEEEVIAQAEKVRKIKQEGKSKAEWQPHVDKLLELKRNLAKLKGEPDPTVKQKGKK